MADTFIDRTAEVDSEEDDHYPDDPDARSPTATGDGDQDSSEEEDDDDEEEAARVSFFVSRLLLIFPTRAHTPEIILTCRSILSPDSQRLHRGRGRRR